MPDALPPNNPEAQSAKPINEATDVELLNFFSGDLISQLKLLWLAAEAETKRLLADPTKAIEEKVEEKNADGQVVNVKTVSKKVRMTSEEMAHALAHAWLETANKIEGVNILAEHLQFRVDNLRARGILCGDPRERKLLNVVPDEAD